jgi:hypothetical protein
VLYYLHTDHLGSASLTTNDIDGDARSERSVRKEVWLIVPYFVPILINLRMAYTLQLAFPATFLIYLVALPMCFPLGMVLAYLLKRKGDATITLEEGL